MFLLQLGVPFMVKVAEVEEIKLESPVETCIYNAIQKVKWVVANAMIEDVSHIIGFDTLVYIEGDVMGKPKTKLQSRKMLLRLSGRWHEVFTGVALWSNERITEDYEKTRVKFHQLTKSQIEFYVNSGETLDKAGSYGIQDKNMSFIDNIEGSFTNVVGFPLNVIRKLFKEAGIKI